MIPEPVPIFAYTQLYEEKLREGQKSTELQFCRALPTNNCTFAISAPMILYQRQRPFNVGKADAEWI